jgi:phasin
MSDTPYTATVTPLEVPGAVRDFAEQGVNQARENYAKLKEAAESANGTMEAVFASATKGATEYGAKLLEIARTNTNSAFDLTSELLTMKSLPQAFELFTSYARKQVEVLTAQSKDLAELSKKVTTDAVEPIKASASKVFKNVA